jgi:hypothetical protein
VVVEYERLTEQSFLANDGAGRYQTMPAGDSGVLWVFQFPTEQDIHQGRGDLIRTCVRMALGQTRQLWGGGYPDGSTTLAVTTNDAEADAHLLKGQMRRLQQKCGIGIKREVPALTKAQFLLKARNGGYRGICKHCEARQDQYLLDQGAEPWWFVRRVGRRPRLRHNNSQRSLAVQRKVRPSATINRITTLVDDMTLPWHGENNPVWLVISHTGFAGMEIIVPAIKAVKDAQPLTRRPLCSHRKENGEVALVFALGDQQVTEKFTQALQENGFRIVDFDGIRLVLEHWNGAQAVHIKQGLTDTTFKRLAVQGWPKRTTAVEEVEDVQMENHSAEGEKVANDGDQMETGSEQEEKAANDEGGVEEMELEDHDEEDEGTANE